MVRNVNLVDDRLFRDGRSAFFKTNAPFSTVTKAVEAKATREIRRRVSRLLPSIANDIANEFGKKSGNARNVIRYSGNRITGTTFSSLRVRIVGPKYIETLDKGGTIKPKGEFLAIPLPPPYGEGAKADGTPKLPSPRAWKNIRKTFTFKAKSGTIFIAYNKTGQGSKGGKRRVLLYALVEEVKVIGKNKINAAYSRRRFEIERIVNQEIQQAFFDYVDSPRQRLLPKARISVGGRGRR